MGEMEILLNIQQQLGDIRSYNEKQFGKIYTEITHVKDVVNQLQNNVNLSDKEVVEIKKVVIPAIEKTLASVAKSADCAVHKGIIATNKEELEKKIAEIAKTSKYVSWTLEKPYRLFMVLFTPPIIVQLSDITYKDLIFFGKNIINLIT